MTRFIIWARNTETDLIRKVRMRFKEMDAGAQILIRAADAFTGPRDIEKCDEVFIQPQFTEIIKAFRAAGMVPRTYLGEKVPVAIGHQSASGVVGLTESQAAFIVNIPGNVGPFGSENEVPNERSVFGCGEFNEAGSNGSAYQASAGIEAQDEGRIPASGPVQESDGLADGSEVSVSRRRGKPRRKA